MDVTELELYFVHHAAVLEGHLPQAAWPRFRRSTGLAVPTRVCTCLQFALHADCEHNSFVAALHGALPLDGIPKHAPRGRKRKAA